MEVGEITVIVMIEDKERGVKVDLDAENYALAIRAHRDKIYVEFYGDVQVTPRSAKAINLESFNILENRDLLE